ncbi:hypothetical protein MKX03_015808 [Papaver bracteatum]|nr:hypothetical protein MKX03_015808 [Papaver bracteatum]
MEEVVEEDIKASEINKFYKLGHFNSLSQTRLIVFFHSGPTQTAVEVEQSEVEVAEGYTITQFCS